MLLESLLSIGGTGFVRYTEVIRSSESPLLEVSLYYHCETLYLPLMQVPKHVRTTCTHQVRDCEYREEGCLFKVNKMAAILH